MLRRAQCHFPIIANLGRCAWSCGIRTFTKAPASSAASSVTPGTAQLAQDLVRGDRLALAKGITLVESIRRDHRVQAQHLLTLVLEHMRRQEQQKLPPAAVDSVQKSNTLWPAFRIGLTGSPGVGKSTFIEAFGMHLIRQGHRVAVLAVDPSSSVTGGSILGDKTRMMELSKHDHSFVRPSPSSGSLGGVARNTNDAIVLCEAAGYDVVLVETVGVGQSETMVADMVDMFALLVPPGGGDELQGLKKGIVELADLILINKSDGALALPAQMTQIEYVSALKLLKPKSEHWRPQVLKVSSVEGKGLTEAWTAMRDFYRLMLRHGELEQRRKQQRKLWMWRLLREQLVAQLMQNPRVKEMVKAVEEDVVQGRLSPGDAADAVLQIALEEVTKKV